MLQTTQILNGLYGIIIREYDWRHVMKYHLSRALRFRVLLMCHPPCPYMENFAVRAWQVLRANDAGLPQTHSAVLSMAICT